MGDEVAAVNKRSHKTAGMSENSRPTGAMIPGYDHYLLVSIIHIVVQDTGVPFDKSCCKTWTSPTNVQAGYWRLMQLDRGLTKQTKPGCFLKAYSIQHTLINSIFQELFKTGDFPEWNPKMSWYLGHKLIPKLKHYQQRFISFFTFATIISSIRHWCDKWMTKTNY